MKLIGLGLLFVAVVLAWASGYQPKPGETVLVLAIEGRGNVSILLHTKEAPKTTAHIIDLAKKGFYDGQRFFRVITTPRPYIVQFGDPNTKSKPLDDPSIGQGGTGVRIPYEDSGKSNVVGAVGLSTPPKERDAGDCQFYINLSNNRFLDGSYTVFGQVVEGMDVVRRIELGDRVTKATIVTGN
ncbi:MAG: peptidylprolyl isomerase [Armatimonadetes bacterium]|jgi:cyclophilin family peptidyl-prolyl cis-trans isomerase|nr:peptidylprolyl isomerase [Armatimonadota bacterium]